MKAVPTLVVLLMVFAWASPATAQTDERNAGDSPVTDRPAAEELERLKNATLTEIDRRLDTVDTLGAAVDAAERLAAPHKDTLSAQLAASRSELVALREAVAGAETLRGLGALVPRIVTDHWIYALMVPKVHEVIAADALVAAAADVSVVHDRIGAVIERAAAAGMDVDGSAGLLRDARAATERARGIAAEVPGTVLPLGPADMPPAGETLVAGAQALGVAFEHLQHSVAATRNAVAELRAAVGQADT